VKVRLGHPSVGPLLLDVLSDFPVHALVSRSGLLQALLDVVGATVIGAGSSSNTTFEKGEGEGEVESETDGGGGSSGSMAVTPVFAVRWFTKLILLGKEAFQQQLSGALCSSIPPTLSHILNNKENSTNTSSNTTSEVVRVPSLADQLVNSRF
jgi:uncharacterized spore protein YtfJ